MGIKIELTDDKIIEPSGGIAMFDLPGREFPGNEDALFDLRWSVIPRREGGIEVFGGNDGKIVLESEEEVKDLREAMIRQLGQNRYSRIQESRCWTANLKGGQLNRIYAKEDKVKIKIEIDSGMISPREYAVRTIAKEIVKTGIKEKQIWYNEVAIQTELENAEVGRLVRCWLKNVWPLPQLRSLRSRLSHLC